MKTPLPEPLSASEIFNAAVDGTPLDPMRVLATFADKRNWIQIYGGRTVSSAYKPRECEWAFIGPVRPPFELAMNTLADQLKENAQ